MKSYLLAACILSLALASAACARAASVEDRAHCTPAYLKQLAREAHNPGQFNLLAGCYEKIQKDNLQQATEEKQEWARRSQNIMATAAKYPRPVDSARGLYEYYLEKASAAERLSRKYSQMASGETLANAR